MSFKELSQYGNTLTGNKEQITLWKLDPQTVNKNDNKIIFTQCYSLLFIVEGKLKLSLHQHTLGSYSLTGIPYGQTYFLSSASEDLHAYLLIMKKDFIDRINREGIPTSIIYLFLNQDISTISIDVDHVGIFLRALLDIKYTFCEQSNLCTEAILYYKIGIFLTLANNYFQTMQEQVSKRYSYTNRQEMLYIRFIRLLSIHIAQERTVAFYASALCVTPQYLEKIVKKISEKTVHSWINETLIQEIEKRLLETDMTIQQIAEELSFSEQASLTRIFKKHKKISPLKFRIRYLRMQQKEQLKLNPDESLL